RHRVEPAQAAGAQQIRHGWSAPWIGGLYKADEPRPAHSSAMEFNVYRQDGTSLGIPGRAEDLVQLGVQDIESLLLGIHAEQQRPAQPLDHADQMPGDLRRIGPGGGLLAL